MNKTVLITGASRGIGRACARVFAGAGYAVAIHYGHSEDVARAALFLCSEDAAFITGQVLGVDGGFAL